MNAGNANQLRESREKVKERKQKALDRISELKMSYRVVFGKEGAMNGDQRAVFEDLIEKCGLYRTSFTGSSKDGQMEALLAAYNDGMRAVIIYMKNMST